jgi:uncharacterized membrane protein (UPF0127 family)
MLRLTLLLGVVVSLGVSCSAPAPAEDTDSARAHASSSSSAKPVARGDVPARLDLATGAVVIDTPAGERRFKVELAVKDTERQRGLMYREKLADDEGMLFLFERQQPLAFWMKNTWIALDMLFITDDLMVLGIVEGAEPLTTSSRKVPGESRFVLELRGGLSSELGLQAGQKVRFEGVPEKLWLKPSQQQEGSAP